MAAGLREALLSECRIGAFRLRNRIALHLDAFGLAGVIPKTRARSEAVEACVSAALLLAEARPSACVGEPSKTQWRAAVHAVGSVVFLKLGSSPAQAVGGLIETRCGQRIGLDRLDVDQIRALIEGYAAASRRALDAGFDGVELDCSAYSNAMRFLSSNSNGRADRYGGSLSRRGRFLLEVLEAMTREVGAHRVAISVEPTVADGSTLDCDPLATHMYVARSVSGFGLAYMRMRLPRQRACNCMTDSFLLMRENYRGALLTQGYRSLEEAARAIARGESELVMARDAQALQALCRVPRMSQADTRGAPGDSAVQVIAGSGGIDMHTNGSERNEE